MVNTFGREIIPKNEGERLNTLHRYKLLESLTPGYFTNLAHIMATTFDTPIALISFVDKESVTFPGNFGLPNTQEVPRGMSLCSLAVLENEPTVFEDALEEPCLLSNPLVAGEFGLRFYAGAPIVTADGYAIGTACIVDKQPRQLTAKEQEMLKNFAAIAMEELELRLKMLQ